MHLALPATCQDYFDSEDDGGAPQEGHATGTSDGGAAAPAQEGDDWRHLDLRPRRRAADDEDEDGGGLLPVRPLPPGQRPALGFAPVLSAQLGEGAPPAAALQAVGGEAAPGSSLLGLSEYEDMDEDEPEGGSGVQGGPSGGQPTQLPQPAAAAGSEAGAGVVHPAAAAGGGGADGGGGGPGVGSTSWSGEPVNKRLKPEGALSEGVGAPGDEL